MDALSCVLLTKIAQYCPHPEVVLCNMRRLNKKIHEEITPLQQTAFVVQHLLKKPNSAHENEIIRLVLDECNRKIQTQRSAAQLNLPLAGVALNSVTLEQHLLKQLLAQKSFEKIASRRIVSRMPVPRPTDFIVPRQPQPQPPPTQPSSSSTSLKSTFMGFFSSSPKK